MQYDVENLTQLLEQLHFEVRHQRNLDYRSFNNALIEFSRDKGAKSKINTTIIKKI